jgi:hypothetical protein
MNTVKKNLREMVDAAMKTKSESAEAGMAAASIEGLFISWSSSITGLSVYD